MLRPRVFISHSSKEPEASELLEELARVLEEREFDVRLDTKRLKASMAWREELDRWLLECHCGVILLSEHALKSEWVKKEANALSTRWRAAGLPLFAVPVGQVNAASLERPDWEPLGLPNVQMVPPGDSAERAVAIADLLEPVRLLYHAASPLWHRQHEVAMKLKDLDSGILALMAESLHIPQIPALPNEEDRRQALAQALLAVSLPKLYGAVDELLKTGQVEVANDVYRLAAPYGWIDPTAAERIIAIARRGRHERAAAINTSEELTCSMYVHRAGADWTSKPVGGALSESGADELYQEVRAVLADRVGLPDADDEEIDAQLKCATRFVALMPFPPPVDDDLLEPTIRAFPNLVMLFRTGPAGRAAIESVQVVDVEYLEPELDPDVEKRSLKEYRQKTNLLKTAIEES